MDVIRDMQSVNTPADTYPSKKQLEKFYDNFVEGKYYGYWSKRFSQEKRASCVHAMSCIRRTIEQIIQVYIDF